MFENQINAAIHQAKINQMKNPQDIPIGCVIVLKNKIISSSANSCINNNRSNEHAEINAINKANLKLKSRFLDECDLYTTLEPCLMCYGAIINARIKTLFIGAQNPKFTLTNEILRLYSLNKINHVPEIILLENQECSLILNDFFKNIRK